MRPFTPFRCATHTSMQMREIGFDGYAIDFVDCPPAMHTYLVRDCQFHRTVSLHLLLLNPHSRCEQPIAFQPNRVDPGRAMEAVSRTGGGSYIIGNILNNITRSQYGKRLPQNLTRDVRPARTLVGPVGSSVLDPPCLFFSC